MKKIFLLLVLASSITQAQNKMLGMEDAVLKARTSLAPQNFKQLMWIKSSIDYSYIGADNNLYKGSAEKDKAQILLRLSELNAALRLQNEDTLLAFPAITWEDVNSFIFKANNKRWMWITALKKLEKKPLENFPEDAENIDKEKKKGFIAFTKNNNLLLWNAGKIYPISKGGNENIVYGESVHRNEFGIKKGTFYPINTKVNPLPYSIKYLKCQYISICMPFLTIEIVAF
jgi:dipeptidyl-peptidase-4